MIRRSEVVAAQQRAAAMVQKAGIVLSDAERAKIEVVDFGYGRLAEFGMSLLTMVSTDRIAVKLLTLFPRQTEPEHWHPPMGNDPGKEETVRVLWGTIYFYVEGPDTVKEGFVPKGKERVYTLRHEMKLGPGDMLYFPPGKKHWFQSGSEGGIMFSFSSVARDVLDCFTDPDIVRVTKIIED